ncbi:phospholipid:diacylglycerol acyltransferase 1-like protein [Tanacetum coccineum]
MPPARRRKGGDFATSALQPQENKNKTKNDNDDNKIKKLKSERMTVGMSDGKGILYEWLVRKRLWGGTFGEVYRRPLSGLSNEKNMYMAAYDWRLSFQNTEVRDQSLSRMKSNIELMVATSGEKVVVIPHSMGVLYFLHFMKWVEAPAPMGGGGGSDWCAEHIKAVTNIGGPFLGLPKVLQGFFLLKLRILLLQELLHLGVLDLDIFGFQTLQHSMRMTRTWDSTMSLIPKGGDTIWGTLDWAPEADHACDAKKVKKKNTQPTDDNGAGFEGLTYGIIISFGKDVAELHSSKVERVD